MRPLRILRLSAVNLRRDLRGLLLSALGVAAGIAALAFFVALGMGVASVVREKVFPADARLVEVVPPRLSLGLLGGGKLDDAAARRLRALPGVTDLYRKMELRVPAVSHYDGPFFGKELRMGVEILGVGVDRELVAADLPRDEPFTDPGEKASFPALVSTRLLEIYNKGFATQRGLPQLSPRLIIGFQFPVYFGRSFVTTAGEGVAQTEQSARLVGVSDRALLQGITLPLDAVRRLNKRYGYDADTYSSLMLVARTPDEVPAITQAVRAMGFEIDDTDRKLAESAGAAVAITTLALALLSALICGVAAVNIALTLGAAIRARSHEIGILRAVGATASAVSMLVVAEAAAVGLLGGLLGAALARLAAFAADSAAARYLPEFPFKPQSFFIFPTWLLVGAVALGVLAALLGAYPPARGAARLDPARAIGG